MRGDHRHRGGVAERSERSDGGFGAVSFGRGQDRLELGGQSRRLGVADRLDRRILAMSSLGSPRSASRTSAAASSAAHGCLLDRSGCQRHTACRV